MTKTSAAEPPSSVDVESLLEREMGQLGRFQLRVLVLCCIATVVAAITTNEFVFTARRINTRCLIPECEAAGEVAEFSPSWLVDAVPSTEDGLDGCSRFAGSGTNVTGTEHTCPVTLFDQDTVLECEKFVYETGNTIVYSMDLGCDEWRRSFVGSTRILGALVSLPVSGFLSDRWGRSTSLAVVCFNTAWMGILRFFATTYVGFVLSVFFEAAFGAGAILACAYVLGTEIVPTRYRVASGALLNTFIAIGQVVLGLLAWGISYWRHLTLVLYVPQLLTLSYFWIMPESIRWYLSKGRYQDAEASLKNIAKSNGKEISEKSLAELKQSAEEENNKLAVKDTSKEPLLVVLVFRHKPILLRCLVIPIWWITTTLVYYGLSINAVDISGNPYLNYILVAAVEIPGFWSAMFLVTRIGRKLVLMIAFWTCCGCMIAYIFIPNSQYAASLTVYLIAKYSIAMVGASLYLYTSELFPTRHRHSLFSFCSMIGRIGSIVAPLTPALGVLVWSQMPFALFAAFALVSGALTLLTPETRGCPLPHTMQDAMHIGDKRVGQKPDSDLVSSL